MISDEQIDSLPEDPEAAFVQYETILREAVREANSDEGYRGWDIERDYVAHILAFVDTRSIPLDLPRNPPSDQQMFGDWYQNFIRGVDYYKAAARLQVSARKRANVSLLTLTPDFKAQIGGHLTAIRNIVAGADISDNKRDAIYRRIANLQEEVDRDRTRTDALVALWLDITSAAGKGAENLEPVFKRLESIMKVFAKAKEETERKALTVPPERKRISAPTTASTQPTGADNVLDDEIPF